MKLNEVAITIEIDDNILHDAVVAALTATVWRIMDTDAISGMEKLVAEHLAKDEKIFQMVVQDIKARLTSNIDLISDDYDEADLGETMNDQKVQYILNRAKEAIKHARRKAIARKRQGPRE